MELLVLQLYQFYQLRQVRGSRQWLIVPVELVLVVDRPVHRSRRKMVLEWIFFLSDLFNSTENLNIQIVITVPSSYEEAFDEVIEDYTRPSASSSSRSGSHNAKQTPLQYRTYGFGTSTGGQSKSKPKNSKLEYHINRNFQKIYRIIFLKILNFYRLIHIRRGFWRRYWRFFHPSTWKLDVPNLRNGNTYQYGIAFNL